jgi:hypothetical protein
VLLVHRSNTGTGVGGYALIRMVNGRSAAASTRAATVGEDDVTSVCVSKSVMIFFQAFMLMLFGSSLCCIRSALCSENGGQTEA